jgi:hypothetical protein
MCVGWMEVPVWYLACSKDLVVPVEIQRMLIQAAKDAGANVKSREIKGVVMRCCCANRESQQSSLAKHWLPLPEMG